jgi:hypothetical protein
MLSASKILIKRSSTPGSVPSANQLESGELALNLADKKIFFKNNQNGISFIDQSPYTLLENLSSVVFKIANNDVTGPYSGILGGYFNDVSGGGSTTINGENNDIAGDFALIGNGLNNTIGINGDYSAILGGKNNTLNHQESFIIGSNITSHLSGFTYVNNLSSLGKIYGDGSNLTGIVAGDTEATTLVRTQSASWGVGGTPQNLSFNEITKDLSLTYGNTVSLSSFGSGGDSLYLKLSGGTITNDLSVGGNLYGDGSNLTGIVAGDTEATTLVRSNSGYWESAYSTVTSLSSNWQTTFTASSAYVSSNPQGITGASALTKMIQITQAGYNSITPASDTLYIIVG